MAKRVKRSQEFYRRALQGDKDNLGLRETARGFGSRNGYVIADLTPAQKRKITIAFHELQELTAQYRHIYKPKNQSKKELEKLEKAKRISQSEYKTDWKVAFIPHVPRVTKSGKISKPRIYFGSESVRIREKSGNHEFIKTEIELNQVELAKNPRREIMRAISSQAPKASRFAVQAGANEIPLFEGIDQIIEIVISLMHKYNGKSLLPVSSGNAGDAPKLHKWNLWLKGLVAYTFKKRDLNFTRESLNLFRDANRVLQKARKAKRERERYAKAKAKYRKSK